MNDDIEVTDGARPLRDVLSVSALNRAVRGLLEGHFGSVWVDGEISNIARPASGHVYFSLKDASAQVRCVMFRSRGRLLQFTPDNGLSVLAHGRVGVYEPRGEYQLVVEHMEPAGEGMLRLRFEQLKRQLAAEGLFEAATKQPLPPWPRTIGVVTSPSGAALRDILQILARRSPVTPVIVYPCSVQGRSAAGEIANAIATANRRAECDVLIVARGGGSLEDLWAFNEEAVARAIHASAIPVVTGVGHEIDYTIADFAADVRAPTPSASAELVTQNCHEVTRALASLEARLRNAVTGAIAGRNNHFGHVRRRLVHPGRRIETLNQRLDELAQRLPKAIDTRVLHYRNRIGSLLTAVGAHRPGRRIAHEMARLAQLDKRVHTATRVRLEILKSRLEERARALRAVSPMATLDRGYAILSDRDGVVARDARHFKPGDRLTARLAKGALDMAVEATHEDGKA